MYHIPHIEIKKNDPFQMIRSSSRPNRSKGRCDMALMNLTQNFSHRTAAAGLAAALAFSPMGGATAQDAQTQQQAEFTQVAVSAPTLAEAGRLAGRYSEENPGIGVAVYLGTHASTPSPERVQEVLMAEFRGAGMTGPVQFFFAQNDIPASGASFFLDGTMDGPYSLSDSRDQARQIVGSYNFRMERGLLASLDYNN